MILPPPAVKGISTSILRSRHRFRQAWRPMCRQAAAEPQPSFARRPDQRSSSNTIFYCPASTSPGSAFAITGAFESADVLSIRIT